jgi:hypothetical protein
LDTKEHYKLLNKWTSEIIEARWYLVEAVAAELLKRKSLSSVELREVISTASQKRLEEDLSREDITRGKDDVG